MEGEIGIEQTPYMKDLDQRDVMAKAEMGFLKVIVQPLWIIMNNFLKNQVTDQVENISNNLKEWENIYNECLESKQKSEKSPVLEESKISASKEEKTDNLASPKKALSVFKSMIKKE